MSFYRDADEQAEREQLAWERDDEQRALAEAEWREAEQREREAKACTCGGVDIGVGTMHEPGCPLGPPVCVHCGCPFDPHTPEPGAEPLRGCLQHDTAADGFVCPGWEEKRL